MDCANLIESSNFNSQGLRRSRRNTQQPVRFTEQYAADIAKTMLDDIPDDEGFLSFGPSAAFEVSLSESAV